MTMTTLNMDESPLNRDWVRTKWTLAPYRSDLFFEQLEETNATLTSFKNTGMYKQAVIDGKIVDDEWVPVSKRKKSS